MPIQGLLWPLHPNTSTAVLSERYTSIPILLCFLVRVSMLVLPLNYSLRPALTLGFSVAGKQQRMRPGWTRQLPWRAAVTCPGSERYKQTGPGADATRSREIYRMEMFRQL